MNVIRAVREAVPGCSLTQAKALIERELPTRVVDGLVREQAEAIITKFAAAGAICVWVETDPALNQEAAGSSTPHDRHDAGLARAADAPPES